MSTRSECIRRLPSSLWPIILVKIGSRQSNSLISYLLSGLKSLRPPSFAKESIIFSTPPNLSINLYEKTKKNNKKKTEILTRGRSWRRLKCDLFKLWRKLRLLIFTFISFFLHTENHLGCSEHNINLLYCCFLLYLLSWLQDNNRLFIHKLLQSTAKHDELHQGKIITPIISTWPFIISAHFITYCNF